MSNQTVELGINIVPKSANIQKIEYYGNTYIFIKYNGCYKLIDFNTYFNSSKKKKVNSTLTVVYFVDESSIILINKSGELTELPTRYNFIKRLLENYDIEFASKRLDRYNINLI